MWSFTLGDWVQRIHWSEICRKIDPLCPSKLFDQTDRCPRLLRIPYVWYNPANRYTYLVAFQVIYSHDSRSPSQSVSQWHRHDPFVCISRMWIHRWNRSLLIDDLYYRCKRLRSTAERVLAESQCQSHSFVWEIHLSTVSQLDQRNQSGQQSYSVRLHLRMVSRAAFGSLQTPGCLYRSDRLRMLESEWTATIAIAVSSTWRRASQSDRAKESLWKTCQRCRRYEIVGMDVQTGKFFVSLQFSALLLSAKAPFARVKMSRFVYRQRNIRF